MKPNRQILDEAAQWLVDMREGEPDTRTRQDFNRWLRRSPEHIEAYMGVAELWVGLPNLASKEDLDIAALIAFAREEDTVVPLERTEAGRRARVRPAFARYGAIAASVGAVALVAAWFVRSLPPTYVTDVGEQRSMVLPDGSGVELNARSRIRVQFSDRERRIELLEGQAQFRVEKDAARPFIVGSDSMWVRAVGTRFDVYRRASGTTVTVLEGRVAVKAPESGSGADVMLDAGQQAVVAPKAAVRTRPANIPTVVAWTQRQILFQGTPLGEVVEEFNRYNRRQITVVDESLRDVRISGVFASTEPASLLRFLREQVQLAVIEHGDAIRIARR